MVTNNAINEGTAASGKILQGQGVGTASAFSTATYPSTATGTGKILIADGTNWVASTPTYPNTSGTAGKVVISDGTNNVYSTPTFPNASATSRKIIVSDGTNWVASTETWATPSTSGNVLKSDGTNWTSAIPGGYTLQMQLGTVGNPADATTYFFRYGSTITASTASGGASQQLFIPVAGTIKACYGSFLIGGLASNENVSLIIRVNNTTDVTVSSTIQMTANPTTFSNNALSQAVSAGDYIEIKMVCPTWGTNPGNVTASLTVYIL